ncbi:MAG: hypothetical protein ACE5IM_03815, partial [Nitrospinota bacterium]
MAVKPLPRSETPELLDAARPPQAHLAGNLRDIARFNRLFGGASALLRPLADLIEADFPDPRTPVSVLDVGTGAGDIPRAVSGWAAAAGRTVRIWAVDVRPDIARIARTTGALPEGL